MLSAGDIMAIRVYVTITAYPQSSTSKKFPRWKKCMQNSSQLSLNEKNCLWITVIRKPNNFQRFNSSSTIKNPRKKMKQPNPSSDPTSTWIKPSPRKLGKHGIPFGPTIGSRNRRERIIHCTLLQIIRNLYARQLFKWPGKSREKRAVLAR